MGITYTQILIFRMECTKIVIRIYHYYLPCTYNLYIVLKFPGFWIFLFFYLILCIYYLFYNLNKLLNHEFDEIFIYFNKKDGLKISLVEGTFTVNSLKFKQS